MQLAEDDHLSLVRRERGDGLPQTPQHLAARQIAQGVVVRGTVELSTDEKLQEEITEKAMRKYLGSEGEQYVDAVLQDGKPGKNRVIAKVKPEHIVAWDFRKGQGAGGG